MADALAVLIEEFQNRFGELTARHGIDLDGVGEDDLRAFARRGAEAAVAPLVWSAAVGDSWDTSTVAEFLGASRQALHDRVRRHTLLGVPGRGVTWFPVWQFDLEQRRVLPAVPPLLTVFADSGSPLTPVEIAGWALQGNPELNGTAPADWIAEGSRDDVLISVARHTAARVAG